MLRVNVTDRIQGFFGSVRRPGFLAASAVIAALAATIIWRPPPLLVWNASPSSPIGLYWMLPLRRPHVSDTVIAWAPLPARRLAASRRYLPLGVPLVKHVAAVAGDRVCAYGGTITVNGRRAARRMLRDSSGRPMPRWSGCRLLRKDELFLLGGPSPLSFDGRYFGVTRADELIGVARLIWAQRASGSNHVQT